MEIPSNICSPIKKTATRINVNGISPSLKLVKEDIKIKQNPFVTQDELAKIVGITRKSIVSNMNKLKENGIIERVGADKNGYWRFIMIK